MKRPARFLPGVVLAVALLGGQANPAQAQTYRYTAPGSYNYTVPAKVFALNVEVSGAGGGGGGGDEGHPGGYGGNGQKISGTLAVTPGQVLTLIVGSGGLGGVSGSNGHPGGDGGASAWGGGGQGGSVGNRPRKRYNAWSGSGGGGGGASAVTLDGATVLVAGGGGGSNGSASAQDGFGGGAGGSGPVVASGRWGQHGVDFGDGDGAGGGGGGGGWFGGLAGKGIPDGAQSGQIRSGGGSGYTDATRVSNPVWANGAGAGGGKGAEAHDFRLAYRGGDGWIAFSPVGPSGGIDFWLKADAGASAGAPWRDSGPNGYDAAPTGNPGYSANEINFNPAVIYASGAGHNLPSMSDVYSSYTFFGVARMSGATNSRVFSSQVGNRLFGYWSGSQNTLYDEGWLTATNPMPVTNGVRLYTLSRNGSAAMNFRGNGAPLYGGAPGSDGVYRMSLGNGGAFPGEWSTVAVPEFIARYDALDAASIAPVESYLALKYGITLERSGVGGSYVNRSGSAVYSDSGTYWNDITGLGRDSGSTLDQRISKSSNATSVLTIATSADMTSANGGNRPALSDGQYLVLGSSAASTAFGSAWSGGNGRMKRVWKAQNTGSVGAVFLSIPNTLSSTAPTLLISMTSDFSSGVTAVPMVASGNLWTASATLPNGAFVSFSDTAGAVGGSALWLKADLGVSGSAGITSWTDQSGSGMTATGVNSPTLVSNGYNYNPTVRFSGGGSSGAPSGGYFSLPSGFSDWSSGMSAYVVVKPASNANSYQRVFDFGNGANSDNLVFYQMGTSNSVAYYTVTSGTNYGTVTAPAGSFSTGALQMLEVVQSAAGSVNLYENSIAVQSGSVPQARGVIRTQNYIGRSNWGNDGMLAGDISELIVYNKANAANERVQIESYLALKYGLTLGDTDATAGGNTPTNYVNSSGAVIWNGITSYAYHNDIAGLGRDSGSTLDQRVSKSVNSSSIMTIATSADITSANGGSRPALSEGQYLVLGSSAASTVFSASWSGGTGRMNRVWKVQNTGNVGAVSLAIPKRIVLSAPVLLVSSSEDFSSGVSTIPMSASGDSWAASATLPNGVFVSFVDGARQPANGALLWLKADVGAGTPGAGVSTWIDQSGADNTLSAVASLPVLTAGSASSFNFNPSVMFNGSSDALASGTSSLGSVSSESTLFVVAKERVRQDNLLFDFTNSLSNRFMAHYPWSDSTLYWDLGGCCNAPNRTYATAPFAAGQSSIGVFTDSVSNNRKEIIVNSAILANSGSGVTVGGLLQTRIGGSQGYYYNGQTSEILVYNRYLTQTERNTVETYLALKYGITLERSGVGGSYVNRSGSAVYSDSGTYWNDITGLGRDSGSTLDQRISKSSNATSVLTIATSADMTSANGGNRPALSDGQYLVLGSSAASTAFGSAWSGGNGRMKRVWKAQNTGSVGAVFLSIPNTLSSTAPTLLISMTSDFSSGVTAVPMVASGNLWTASATLPNGAFVSFSDTAGAVGGSALWLKADLGVSGSAGITSWTDQSGSGMTATGVNSPTLVSNGYNYNPTVRFSGGGSSGAPSGGYFSLPSGFSDWSSGMSAYVVVKPASNANSYQRVFDFGNGAGSDNLLLTQVGTSNAIRCDFYNGGGAGSVGGIAGTFTPNAPQMLEVVQSAAGAASLYENGSVVQSANVPQLRGIVRTLNYIGRSNWGYDGMLAGDISELIVYNKTNAANERVQIESYLALKYGLTLGDVDATAGSNTPNNYVNSSGTVVWNGAANANYHNDIAGLGRDNGSTLDQRISKSASSTSIMTIATSADMTSVNGGSRPALSEGQYLILGSSTASTAFGGAWSGANGRMNRVWKVQNTGNVGGVTPAIPGSIAFPSGIPVVLIESAAGSGNFATATTKAYLLGKQGNFWVPVSAVGSSSPQSVSLPDGAYVSYGVATLPISLIETSIGGNGVFTFSLTNADTDLSTPAQDSQATITTSAPATPTPYDANASLAGVQSIQATNPNTDVVLTINPVAGWALNPNSFCSDGTNTFPLAGNTIVLPAANLVLGAALTCNIGHTRIGLAVSGKVFIDNGAGNGGANNGVVDGAEAGLPGVAMQLTNCAGTVYATASSDGGGAYTLAFPSNFSGNVCVVQGPVAAYLTSGANVAGMALQDSAAWLVGGTRYLWTRANRSIAFAANANTNYADVNFGNIPVASFVLSAARTAPAGSAPVYAHTLNAGSTGSVSFSVSANDAPGPWNEALYLDANCNGSQDPADPLIEGPLALVAGKPLCVLLKEFIPAGLSNGVSRVVVVKATVNYAGAAPQLTQILTVTDATTVGDAQLQLDKKVRNVTRGGDFAASNSAATGDILEYQVVYTNVSAQPIGRLTVADATPPYTRFLSASAAALPAKLLSCTKKTPTSSTPVSCNTDDTEGGGGSVVWSFTGSLAPAQSGSVSFRVRVD